MLQIADGLRAAGLTSTHDVDAWDDYGWSLTFDVGDRPMSVMLQRSDAWLLMAWVHSTWFERLRGGADPVEAEQLRAAIERRVRSVATVRIGRWLSEGEFHAGSMSR